ncbi:MAG: HNH endonuclease, partial [Trebonia sp.]
DGPSDGAPDGGGPAEPRPGSAGRQWPVIPPTADVAAPGCARLPAWLRPKVQGRARLHLPWRTAAGMASLPGELARYGPIPPGQARDLAAAAAADPAVRWQVIVTHDDGRALAVTILGGRRDTAATGLIDEVTVTIAASLAEGLDSDDATRHWAASLLDGIRAAGRPELASILGKIITAARKAAAEAEMRALLDEQAGGCAHTIQVTGYKVPDTMRRWIIARDRTCRNPVCRRRAAQCDADHTRPYHKGGRTCPCGLGPLCRGHHELKQLPGWHLAQDAQGYFTWTTPAGLTYREEPFKYAV